MKIVVYLYIPTSNHNRYAELKSSFDVVYLYPLAELI